MVQGWRRESLSISHHVFQNVKKRTHICVKKVKQIASDCRLSSRKVRTHGKLISPNDPGDTRSVESPSRLLFRLRAHNELATDVKMQRWDLIGRAFQSAMCTNPSGAISEINIVA